jgi:hypothetical protein
MAEPTSMSQSDAELVAKSLAGQRDAFGQIVGRYQTLKTYPGGHGWRPFTYYFDAVKEGIQWLQKPAATPASR